MTTVAYDGTSMAADTQASGQFLFQIKKLFRLKDGSLCGIAGTYDTGYAIVQWLDGVEERPDNTHEDSGATLLLVRPNGKAYLYERLLMPIPVTGKHAIGSGATAAMVAMHMGADAKKAVKIAGRFDIHTNTNISSMRLNSA